MTTATVIEVPRALRVRLAHAIGAPLVARVFGESLPLNGPRWNREWGASATPGAIQAAVAASCPGRTTRVVSLHNPRFHETSLHFAYQDATDPRLRELDATLGLSALRTDTADELQLFRRITSLVRGLADHTDAGASDQYPHNGSRDAFAIVRAARNGQTLNCFTYSMLLIQSLAAMGYTSRLVSAGYSEPREHGAVEAWSTQYHKWILLDPDNDLLYMRGDVPLSALDLQQVESSVERHFQQWAVEQERDPSSLELAEFVNTHPELLEGVRPVRGPVQSGRIPRILGRTPTRIALEMYRSFSVSLRNDYLSVSYPLLHPQRWGEAAPPAGAAHWLAAFDGVFVDNVADLYWPLDVVRMAFAPAGDSCAVRVSFGTVTPGFRGLLITTNGEAGREMIGSTMLWNLTDGENSIAVRAVNQQGVQGELSSATILVQ